MISLIELPGSQINTTKWNKLINNSNNGLIYHSIPFLNEMTKHWKALILGDYEFAMPIIYKKKLGSVFLQQMPFIQQLGIIGNEINEEIQNIFVEYLNKNFDYIHYSLNFNNPNPHLKKKSNYIISLDESYNDISEKFNTDAKANIKKSQRQALTYIENNDPEKTIFQFKALYGNRFSHVTKKYYLRLTAFCINNKQNWISREIYFEKKLCASSLILKDTKRLYFLINNVTPIGREKEANYFMIDQLIHEFSESNLILDFEGSDLQGIAEFYLKFGAVNQPYYELVSNNLPFYLKLFKK